MMTLRSILVHAAMCMVLLTSSTTASVKAQFQPEQCYGFAALEFKITDFDRYETMFRPDAVVRQAQAGKYTGLQAVEEYVRFSNEAGPYFTRADKISEQLSLKTMDPTTGTCVFFLIYSIDYETDPANALDANFYMGIALKIYYEIPHHQVSAVDIFFQQQTINFVFGTALSTDQTREYVCNIMHSNCPETLQLNGNPTLDECKRNLEDLPALTAPSGGTALERTSGNGFLDDQFQTVDGNDSGCRALHASLAVLNDDHCAHISFVRQLDPKGVYKCQDSNPIPIADLFDEDDLKMFNEFLVSEESQIGTLDGYRVISVNNEDNDIVSDAPSQAPTADDDKESGDDSDSNNNVGKGLNGMGSDAMMGTSSSSKNFGLSSLFILFLSVVMAFVFC